MHPILLAVATLGLAACASTQTVLDKEPREVLFSENSQAEVAFCLANKTNSAALDREDGSKVVLVKNTYGAVGLVFSVFEDPKGSRIEYRRQIGFGGYAWRECIEG